MIRFDKLLERWAELYKPLSHNPDKSQKQQAFYRVDALSSENEFVRSINSAKSPAMAFSTLVDAKVAPGDKAVSYLNTVYFMVKQTSSGMKTTPKTDDDAACECKADLDEMCQDLCAFLAELRRAANAGLKMLVFSEPDASNISFDSPMQDEVKSIAFPITSENINAYRGIDISSVNWGSLPQFKNGWWVFAFQFEVKEPRNLCLVSSKYNFGRDNV